MSKVKKWNYDTYQYDLYVDLLQNILNQYFDVPNDTYAYNLTRVKSAFDVGTMTIEDFEEFNQETTRDLAEYIIEHLIKASVKNKR